MSRYNPLVAAHKAKQAKQAALARVYMKAHKPAHLFMPETPRKRKSQNRKRVVNGIRKLQAQAAPKLAHCSSPFVAHANGAWA